MKIFADIQKVDDEMRLVYGYASTEAMDSQKEIVTKGAMVAALPAYMKFANVHEMHKPSAVGVAEDAQIDDKGLYITAKVVDPHAWEKVKAGVYKGFSIGGKATARDPDQRHIITGLDLTEISLVDRPANPESVFDFYKVDDGDTTDQVPLEEGVVAPAVESAPAEIEDTVDPPAPAPVEEAIAEKLDTAAVAEPEAVEKAKGVQESDSMSSMAVEHRNKAREHMANAASMRTMGDEPGARSEDARADAHTGAAMHLEMASTNMKMIGKAEAEPVVEKRGARLSSEDQKRMDTAHDSLVLAGANCPGMSSGKGDLDTEIAKATDGLSKRVTDLESENEILKAERDALGTEKTGLIEKMDALKAEVETLKLLPADTVAAPVLRTVEKAEDVLGAESVKKSAEVKPEANKWFGFNPNGVRPDPLHQ